MNSLLALLIVPITGSAVAAILHRYRFVERLITFLTFCGTFLFLFGIKIGDIFTWHLDFLGKNVEMGLQITPLSIFMLYMTIAFGIVLTFYNLSERSKMKGFLLLLTLTASNWIFMSTDLISFFFAWELMGWSSILMIFGGKHEEKSRHGALYYAMMSIGGSYSMLIGIFLLSNLTGTFSIQSNVSYLMSIMSVHPWWIIGIVSLFFVAFMVKSGIFPFHTWVPYTYGEAPDGFVPYLSSVMSKYGVYGFLIFLPLTLNEHVPSVFGLAWPNYVLLWFGSVTAVVGSVLAFMQDDVKKLFAYSSFSNLGFVLAAISLFTPIGLTAGLFHAFNHLLFNGAIFITVIAVISKVGTTRMSEMGGIWQKMPLTFLTFFIGIAAAAGIPPFAGFGSKWMIFQAMISHGLIFATVLLFFASIASFLYLMRAFHAIFLGQLSHKYDNLKEVSMIGKITEVFLLGALIFFGILPGFILDPIDSIVSAFGLKPLPTSGYEYINGFFSSINMVSIFIVVIIAFIFGFALFAVVAKHKKVPQEDNYTAGQIPQDWNLTPEMYQFSYDFYEPMDKELAPFLKVKIDGFFKGFGESVKYIGGAVKEIFTGNVQIYTYLAVGGLVIFVIAGWVVW
jgi:NADH-quinone oxidoreductase subunit M